MLNKVILMGRLTKDPEIKSSMQGKSISTFTLAVDRGYVKPGEERQADFINIVTFNSTADFVARYFEKGQLVAVCGRLQTRNWEDNEGKRHYATEVVAEEAHFAESKRDAANPQRTENSFTSAPPAGFTVDVDDDDLPF